LFTHLIAPNEVKAQVFPHPAGLAPPPVRFFTKKRKETPTGTAESRRMVLCFVMMIYSEGRKKITASDKPVTLPRQNTKGNAPKGQRLIGIENLPRFFPVKCGISPYFPQSADVANQVIMYRRVPRYRGKHEKQRFFRVRWNSEKLPLEMCFAP